MREGDSLARLGGDEFVAVLIDLEGVSACLPLVTRLLAAAAQPIQMDGVTMRVSASVGITFYPQHEEIDADQMLRQADQAMYQAKLAGKNRFQFFDAAQDSSVRVHHENLERIRLALEQREFVLCYQPKVNMRTGEVIGVESLIRWQHPERGLLLPAVFLPAIENDPLAVTIGEWVIDTALAQVERWHAGGLGLPVSVKICASMLPNRSLLAGKAGSYVRVAYGYEEPILGCSGMSAEVIQLADFRARKSFAISGVYLRRYAVRR